jgi:hypothetical protein
MHQIELTDTQAVILSAACAREDGAVFPVTAKLKVSIGIETGPQIGAQKGPSFRVGGWARRERARRHGAL